MITRILTHKTLPVLLLLTALLAIIFSPKSSASFPPDCDILGTAVYVDDGDTAKVQTNNGKVLNIRFYGIDSPEKSWPGVWPAQPFSNKAKQYVSRLILNKPVCVRLTGDKTYKRKVGEIFLSTGKSIGLAVVREGLAWWNKKYAPNDSSLRTAQEEAMKNHRGIWSQNNPEPPWQFRRRHRSN